MILKSAFRRLVIPVTGTLVVQRGQKDLIVEGATEVKQHLKQIFIIDTQIAV